MPLETGRVIRSEHGQAVVEVQKGADCARCHVGCACNFGDKSVMITADDSFGVQADDIVSLEIPEGNVLLAVFVVYVVPLIGLIAGILIGDALGETFGNDLLLEVLGGMVGVGLSIPIIRYYNSTFKRHSNHRPRIRQIMKS